MSTQGGQSLSDFVIDMRVCVRCHSTEQQSQKHQRVAERQLFFNSESQHRLYPALTLVLHKLKVCYSKSHIIFPSNDKEIHHRAYDCGPERYVRACTKN